MRIVVEDVAASKDAGGVWSVLEDFYQQVRNLDDNNDWFFIVSENSFQETDNIHIIVRKDLKKSWFKRLAFEFSAGRKLINDLHPDVVFSLQNTISLGLTAKQKFVYLHQPIPYQRNKKFSFFKKDERKLFLYQFLVGKIINYTLKKARPEIIVQTTWMKEELIRRKIALDRKIIVFQPTDLVQVNESSVSLDHTFFYPASSFIYKNHATLFDAARILVNHGILNFKIKCTANASDFPKQDMPSQVEFIGKIPRSEVLKEYRKSVLVFPSYIETFGLPLLEAAETGTVVLASDTSFSHEVLNGYENAYYFKFDDATHLAELMARVLKKDLLLKANVRFKPASQNQKNLVSIVTENRGK